MNSALASLLPAPSLPFRGEVATLAMQRACLHADMLVARLGSVEDDLTTALAARVARVHVIAGSADRPGSPHPAAGSHPPHLSPADAFPPLSDAALDALFAGVDLPHCHDPLSILRELLRFLRPGGRLVLLTPGEPIYIRERFEQAGLVNVIVQQAGAQTGLLLAVGTARIAAREAVQQAYALRAVAGAGCCSGPDCCTTDPIPLEQVPPASVHFEGGYQAAELASVPAEAAEFSLGCGNPLAMAELQPGETVLDIGSGGGLDCFLAARRVGSTGRVIGVDMTPAMLERARRAAARGGYDNVEFRQGDAAALPLDDASVDVIISNCVINLTEDKGRVFREAFRVLRPGGRLEVNDMVFGAPPPAVRISPQGWSGCVSGALPEQEYLDLVAMAGFADIRVRRGPSAGEVAGAPIYSVQVSARKPLAPQPEAQ